MCEGKILMIHGNGQSGIFFECKTRFLHEPLEQILSSSFTRLTFVYPDGPISGQHFVENTGMNDPSEVHQNAGDGEQEQDWRAWAYGDPEKSCVGFERSLHHIFEILNHEGPFIGVIGFSVGAALAAMVAALLEGKHVRGLDLTIHHPPLGFIICFGGFGMTEQFKGLYEPKIRTPSLHFTGCFDSHISSELTWKLSSTFIQSQVHCFMGAHFVPRGKKVVERVIEFLKGVLMVEAKLKDVN